MSQDNIDPVTLARFMVLPGAARLVAAFSGVPAHAVRETIIAHAEAIAQAFAAAPAHMRAPDPLQGVFAGQDGAHDSGRGGGRPALAAPRGPNLTETPELRAVELMMQGLMPAEAAQHTGLTLKEVVAMRREAKAKGVHFPRLKMTQVVTGKPVAQGRNFAVTATEIGSIHAARRMEEAAKRLGMSLQDYLGARADFLRRYKAGETVAEIARTKGLSVQLVHNWRTYARQAGALDVTDYVQAAGAHA